MLKATCSVEVCDEPAYGRGWCKAHHQRWLTKGDAGTTPVRKKRPGAKCSVPACDRPHQSRDWCKAHYQRWVNTGDAGSDAIHDHVAPDERLTYRAVHLRLKASRGPALGYPCISCGGAAKQWAYQHNDPAPMRDDLGLPYSANPDCYAPMCVPCHKRFDLSQ